MARTLRRLLDPGDWLAVKPRLDPKAIALEIHHVPGRAAAGLSIGTGVFFLVVAFVAAYAAGPFLFLGAFGVAFIGLFKIIYGVRLSGFSLSLLITDSEVVVDRKTLLGQKRWREPLRNYRGVLLREREIQDTSGGAEMAWTSDYHIIELAHTDDSKTVPLYVVEGGPSPRQVQEAFSRRFGLPALAPGLDADSERSVAELDRKLCDQAPPAEPGRPPSGMRVIRQNGTTRLIVGTGRLGRSLVWLYWLALPPVFGGLVYQLDPVMGYFTAGAVTIGILVLFGISALFRKFERKPERSIRIDGERVWVDQQWLPRSAIEQVRVDQYTSHMSGLGGSGGVTTTFHPRLVIESDAGRLEYIGAQFDRRKLQWVRDYLRYRLAGRSTEH